MKKALLILFLALPGTALCGGVPVIDSAAIQQAVQNLMQLQKEYEVIVKQYEEQVRTLEALSGRRNLGKTLWDPLARELLPGGASGVLSSIQKSGKSAVTSDASRILTSLGTLEACEPLRAAEKAVCEKKAAAAAQSRAFYEAAEKTASERSERIEELLSKINDTSDMKASSDLASRIGAETASLEAEKARLEAARAIAEENSRLLALEADRVAASRWSVPSDWKKYLK